MTGNDLSTNNTLKEIYFLSYFLHSFGCFFSAAMSTCRHPIGMENKHCWCVGVGGSLWGFNLLLLAANVTA